jgi:DNA repair exonuclease SbcCD nuclease subunit
VREVKKKFKLILSADWHLRDDIPQCRERDEYLVAQERKLKFIHDLCEEHGATLLIAGDLFDNWKPSPWLISLALRYIPIGTVVVPGQHDMVARNMQEMGKTGLQTLAEAGAIVILSGGLRRVLGDPTASYGAVYGWAYGEEAQTRRKGDKGVKILMWHRLVCENKQPWPGAEAMLRLDLLRKFGGFNLTVTGDNHQSFCGNDSDHKTFLVNPGSLMRMSSDQSDFEPAVFGWSEDGTVTRIPLPIEKGVVKENKSNAKAKESRDQRMEAYIKKASTQFEDRLSFDKNLERHFATNKETKGVETIVWKAVGNNEKQ